jgi:chromosome segregation ATPase
MSTYFSTSCCQKINTKCLSGNLYNQKEDKDTIISRLNSRIVKLEQKEKDYDLLNQEFKQLENDYSLLKEAKLRLEYEIKQRNEAYNKRICDLKGENENLQDALNDKMCVNKKLYEERQCLENQLNRKNSEIDDLNNKINNTNNKLDLTQNDNNNLQNTLRGLNDLKAKQRDKIAELVNDNKKLAKLCQDQDHSIYLAEQEKQKLGQKLNQDNAHINNLNSKLRIQGNTLNNLQKQLDNSNNLNLKLQNNLRDLDNNYANYKLDNQNLKDGLNQERFGREDEERKNDELRNILNDRQKKLRFLNNDYICLKNGQEKNTEIRNIYQTENDKLKEHCMILTRQNQDLSNEIDNVIREDEHMKDVLNRTERMSSILKTNDNIISQLPQDVLSFTACFEENRSCIYPENKLSLSQSMGRERTYSPKFTYNRIDNKI